MTTMSYLNNFHLHIQIDMHFKNVCVLQLKPMSNR